MNKPTGITLFSGVGCSSLALRNLGLDVTAHEIAPAPVRSLRANGFRVVAGDVRKVDFRRYRNAVALVGGPPCQPFSQAHQGDGEFDDRDMIPEFIRAVAEALPEVFVMEEVQTLTWARHRAYLRTVTDALRILGYQVEGKVLNAANYGSAQARKRLFVVGVRADLDRQVAWPKTSPGPTMANFLDWDAATCFERNQAVPDPRARVKFEDPRWEWPLLRPAMTVVGSFRPEVMAAPGYRVAGDPPRQGTPGSMYLTEDERKLLMGLPKTWAVIGSDSERALQIGNGAVVSLVEQIVEANL